VGQTSIALNTLICNHLTPLGFEGLNICTCCRIVFAYSRILYYVNTAAIFNVYKYCLLFAHFKFKLHIVIYVLTHAMQSFSLSDEH